MAESTVKLPVEVKADDALAELRKVQKQLAAAGLESQKLNQEIGFHVAAAAKKTGKSYEDMAAKASKETERLAKKAADELARLSAKAAKDAETSARKAINEIVKVNTKARAEAEKAAKESLMNVGKFWGELNQKLEVFSKVVNWGKQTIELAKFSSEFRRLEGVIPVSKMRELEQQTGGTVSRFELLKRAAEEMGIGATDGMSATAKSLQRVTMEWTNTMDQIKATIGDLVGSAILWIDRLSDKLAGIDPESRGNARQRLRANAAANAMDRFRELGPVPLIKAGLHPIHATDEDIRRTPEFQKYYKESLEALAPKYLEAEEKENASAPGSGAPSWLRGIGKDDKTVSLGNAWQQFKLHTNTERAKKKKGTKGKQDYRWEGTFSSVNGNNPLAYQNMPWQSYLGNAAQESYQEMGGADTGDFISGAVENTALGKGLGNLFSGFGAAAEAGGGGAKRVAEFNPGKVSEFWAEMKPTMEEMSTVLTDGFGVLQGGIAAAVEAAISGEESIGKAFKKSAAAALKSIALQSTVRALYHGAMALGSLAFFDGRGAGMHAAAAAKFGLAAAAAGIGSAALGGFDTAPTQPEAGGGSSSRAVTGSQLSNGNGNQVINVYVQGAIGAGDYARLGGEIVKAVDAGRRSGRVRDEHSVTTRFE